MNQMVAVVIPYYQREPGILRKALFSVFASEGVENVHILVIDDGSPVSAKSELAEIGTTRFPVTLIQQENSGPGGARNTGLENLPDNVDYIAFLDSDDIWSNKHLHNAVVALTSGYDVYFCNHVQLGGETSAFERAGKINTSLHKTISAQADLHAYQGDMFNQIITGNIIGTSTVVFSKQKFANVRFRTDLTTAGEDYLFWLELSHRGAHFAFGSTPSVFYGKGVNVYAGSGWGTEGYARRIVHELTYRKALLSIYQLNVQQYAIVEEAIRHLDDSFVRDCMHRVAHKKPISWKLVSTILRMEPRIVYVALKILVNKISTFPFNR